MTIEFGNVGHLEKDGFKIHVNPWYIVNDCLILFIPFRKEFEMDKKLTNPKFVQS